MLHMSRVIYQAGTYPVFSSIKQPGVYFHLSTPPWMGCKSMVGLPPSIKFSSTHSYTWVESGTVRVKWFAKKHNSQGPSLDFIRLVHICTNITK